MYAPSGEGASGFSGNAPVEPFLASTPARKPAFANSEYIISQYPISVSAPWLCGQD